MADYEWTSPGGLYVVPDSWRQQFLSEFPDYRVRWSLQKDCWQIEQRVGRGALPAMRIDPTDDSLIRARDGYWLVMEFQPGDRMACPAITERFPLQRCGGTMKVSHREARETICRYCRLKGRDGRTMASYWPFGEALLEHLRWSDPLRGGTTRQREETDVRNKALMREAERRQADAMTSLDYVDYRWLTGIPTAGHSRRQIDHTTFR